MNIQEIVKYATSTPHNTNPNVLKSMLENELFSFKNTYCLIKYVKNGDYEQVGEAEVDGGYIWPLYKISDHALSSEELIGAMIIIKDGATAMGFEIVADLVTEEEGEVCYSLNGKDPYIITTPEIGTVTLAAAGSGDHDEFWLFYKVKY